MAFNFPVHPDAILMAQHREVELLFDEILKEVHPQNRTKILTQIAEKLTLHTFLEEQVVYPVLKLLPATGPGLASHAVECHDDVIESIKSLMNLPADHPEWVFQFLICS